MSQKQREWRQSRSAKRPPREWASQDKDFMQQSGLSVLLTVINARKAKQPSHHPRLWDNQNPKWRFTQYRAWSLKLTCNCQYTRVRLGSRMHTCLSVFGFLQMSEWWWCSLGWWNKLLIRTVFTTVRHDSPQKQYYHFSLFASTNHKLCSWTI